VNSVDIFVLVLVAFFTGRGIWRGFINEWSGLVGLAVGYFLIQKYTEPTGAWLSNAFEWGISNATLVGKFVLFLGGYLVVVLLGKLLTKVLKLVWLGWANRLLGGISGLAKGIVFTALLWAAYTDLFVPRFAVTEPLEGESWVYRSLNSAKNTLLDLGAAYLPEVGEGVE
jgi:membrane protein required for colicin V production